MEKIILICVLFYGCLLHITYSDVSGQEQEVSNLTAQLGETVTLNCNMTNRNKISWFHLKSEKLTLLVSAQKDRTTGRRLLINYNPNARLKLNADSGITVVSLGIFEITPSDLGLYFCGTQSDISEMLFDRAIRLQTEEKLRLKDNGQALNKLKAKDVKITDDDDDLTVKERVWMFGGVGLAILIFFVATVAAGGIIHHRGWQKGWSAGKDAIALSSD